MMPSIAAGRAGKARLSEHMEVRVRAGARPARSAGESSQPDVGETVMPGAMVLATFAETKVARSPGRRAEKDMDVVLRLALRQVFPSPCQAPAALGFPLPQAGEGKSCPAFGGMTPKARSGRLRKHRRQSFQMCVRHFAARLRVGFRILAFAVQVACGEFFEEAAGLLREHLPVAA